MQNVSTLFNTLWAERTKTVEVHAVIGENTYDMNELYGAQISRDLFTSDVPSVGGTRVGELKLSIVPQNPIPPMAEIKIETRITTDTQESEWRPKGTFYIDTRGEEGEEDLKRLDITAYDAMLKAEQEYAPLTAFDEWPRTDTEVVDEIASLMGVEIDPRTTLKGYSVPYPNDLTMREVLGYIAASNAGNLTITDDNKLLLVKLNDAGKHLIDVERDADTLRDLGKQAEYTGVTVWWSDENAFKAGDDSGAVLELDCPWATQAMADAILADIEGYSYQGAESTLAEVTPAAELCDTVKCNGITFPLARYTVDFDGTYLPDVAAPADAEVDSEYHYESRTQRELARRAKLGESYYGVKLTREKGVEIVRVDGGGGQGSRAVLNADTLEFYDNSGNKVLWFDPISNKYYFLGDVNVTGTVVTETLYTVFGDMAHLTVDRLKTSRRIPLYLARNTSDDNYIDIVGESFEMIAGEYAGGTEQATNPNGELIYWESDPEGAGVTIGADGYPYLDGNRILTTTEFTAYPVTVYTYTDTVKARWDFQQAGDGTYQPVLTMGAGDGAGANYATMLKGTEGLELVFRAMGGKELGLKAGYTESGGAGYLDLYGLRKTTKMDFSDWDSGVFTETLDGGGVAQYNVTFDAQGRPVSITDSSGHITEVVW